MSQCLYEVIIGNVIGIVEDPAIIDPTRPMAEQIMVKIGAVDPRQPLSKDDAEQVIERLRAFVLAPSFPGNDTADGESPTGRDTFPLARPTDP